MNLPVHGGGGLASFGEPGFISLRALVRSPPPFAVAQREIYVCENPNIVAIAADELGPRCAPLVCTEGMPAGAQRRLLMQLRAAGARLRYHGDFDWAGLRIANYVMREIGSEPWQFGTPAYEEAVRHSAGRHHPLNGPKIDAAWDDGLSESMLRHGVAIAEEAVATTLVRDLDTKPT